MLLVYNFTIELVYLIVGASSYRSQSCCCIGSFQMQGLWIDGKLELIVDPYQILERFIILFSKYVYKFFSVNIL